LICGNIQKESTSLKPKDDKTNLDQDVLFHDGKAKAIQKWFKDEKVNSFYKTVFNNNMFLGADSLIQSVGIGSLRPNTLLMGFKKDWRTAEPESVKHYIDTIHRAFRCKFGVGILRMPVESAQEESTALKSGQTENYFREHDKKGAKKRIDVWWLVDDGGLCILVAHLMQKQKDFKDANIRIFTGLGTKGEVDSKQRRMKALMEKFRISFESIEIVTDLAAHPSEADKRAYLSDIRDFSTNFDGQAAADSGEPANANSKDRSGTGQSAASASGNKQDLSPQKSTAETKFQKNVVAEPGNSNVIASDDSKKPKYGDFPIDGSNFQRMKNTPEKNKSWRQLTHNRVLIQYSKEGKQNEPKKKKGDKDSRGTYLPENKADLVIVSCPVAKNTVSPYLYMSWLDALSKDLDVPVLMLRGNMENAITFYMS